jgi:hypothetical protein
MGDPSLCLKNGSARDDLFRTVNFKFTPPLTGYSESTERRGKWIAARAVRLCR